MLEYYKKKLKESEKTRRDFAITENEKLMKAFSRSLITEKELKESYNCLVELLKEY